jgi:hypothetical protein
MQVGEMAGAYVDCFVESGTFDRAEETSLGFLKKKDGRRLLLMRARKPLERAARMIQKA